MADLQEMNIEAGRFKRYVAGVLGVSPSTLAKYGNGFELTEMSGINMVMIMERQKVSQTLIS
jgi:hypothetical protein